MLPNMEIKDLISLVPGFKIKKKKDDNHEEIYNAIVIAHQEWLDAQIFFENVNDNDLIDHAIHKIEAAKSKYTYLLKLARQNGVKIEY